jgi:hypothetical protein
LCDYNPNALGYGGKCWIIFLICTYVIYTYYDGW